MNKHVYHVKRMHLLIVLAFANVTQVMRGMRHWIHVKTNHAYLRTILTQYLGIDIYVLRIVANVLA